MSFAADIRKPCEFSLNRNLIEYMCDDFEIEIELGDDLIQSIALEAEHQIWSKLCKGMSVSIYKVVHELISEAVYDMGVAWTSTS